MFFLNILFTLNLINQCRYGWKWIDVEVLLVNVVVFVQIARLERFSHSLLSFALYVAIENIKDGDRNELDDKEEADWKALVRQAQHDADHHVSS
mgnify:CR=1 FL=1